MIPWSDILDTITLMIIMQGSKTRHMGLSLFCNPQDLVHQLVVYSLVGSRLCSRKIYLME
jgi:hypothetical protein